ncbi:zonular occludens toxin domain-containing protein [Xanthomonas sp. CFBP 8445]|uniref:zonular occludens toxin domain-containing protein n=1 Tax=Xanthomonas sp. CFBP 8445 TaxID=2971236 RepID=UPI0021E0B573|nr:zonular occludens toxin domain-containing protein [Xanthomonas sp. CFBP 8445]UYC14017.1 zonular occludens toxin [Xanthomonas sp. CFBP 8445]
MALYLVTGQPGHGKTAYALDKAFTFKKEGRKIYASGVKDLDYEKAGFTYLDDPTKWQDLPDGAVILLDECYTVFPNRNPGAKVPDHVEAMARHRHRGFDFILIAQQGLQLDPFLRGLYEEHVHVRQTSVMRSKTKLKRWNQYQSNVQGACNDIVDWVRPKYVFDYYTSTTLVTTKRTVPMWIRYVVGGLVVLAVILFGIRWYFASKIAGYQAEHDPAEHPQQTRDGTTAKGGTIERGGGVARTYATATDYATAHLARFPTMPWTAPIYDGAAPVGQPQLFCMSSLGGKDGQGHTTEPSCTCMTEQGTKYDLPQPQCRTVALNGPPYNPYKQPSAPPAPYVPPQAQDAPQAHAGAPLQGSVIAKLPRAQGTFPEHPQAKSETYTPATTLEM